MLLAIDTSADYVSIALFKEKKAVNHIHQEMSHGQGENLIPLIQKLLADNNTSIKDITQVAVSVGPGSFTGVRIGLSCARAFSLALNIPALGITNFEATAFNLSQPVKVILDSKRGDFFVQDFDKNGAAISEPSIQSAQQLKVCMPFIAVGSGANALAEEIGCKVINQPLSSAIAIGSIALTKPTAILPPIPLYLRDADVTI